MTSRKAWIQPEAVLTAIREHGPITKSSLGILLSGSVNPRLERILDDLTEQRAISLSKGLPKNGKRQTGWVYSAVTP